MQTLVSIPLQGWAIILALVTAVAGYVVAVFREDIRDWFRRDQPDSYLLGSWDAAYSGESETRIPTAAGTTFSGARIAVNVTSLKGSKLTAEEEGGCERRVLKGQLTPFFLSLTYTADDPPHQRNGVLLLARRGQNLLVGRWAELAGNGILHWGAATWSRNVDRPKGLTGHRAASTDD